MEVAVPQFMPESCIIVLPVYNEAGCIHEVCRDWITVLERHERFRLLLVNDGSTDGTAAILADLAAADPRIEVLTKSNGGHGSAVIHAYERALQTDCDYVFQVDSDGQFVASDFELLWTRRHSSSFILGRRTQREDSRARVFLSGAYRELLRVMFGANMPDPNIPFRLMRSSLLLELTERVPPGTFAPNVFLSLLAAKAGEPSLDVPVQHRGRKTGTVSIKGWKMARIALRCFREMLAFRFGEFAGFRERQPQALRTGPQE